MIKIVTKTKKKLTKATNVKAVVKSNRKKSVGRKSVGRKLVKKPHTRKKATLFVPTNNREKLVDLGLMKPQSHISETRPTLTVIHKMNHLSGRQYEIENEPTCVSTVLKFVLKVHQTNELSESWTLALWNINQKDILPEGVTLTFVRSFERRDNEFTKKQITRRRRLAVLSSESGENVAKQSASVTHDLNLLRAINQGDSVVGFAAEVLLTAPNEHVLEEAVSAVTDYLAANDETRGIHYALDINKLAQPLLTYGPNKPSGNKDVMYEMTAYDAAQTALFVDSGGDRTIGAEYVGVSVGKLIRSHAAYNFQNHRAMFVGNDTNNLTHTIGGVVHEPSQIYLSKVASRSYLLQGQSVTHIVCDHIDNVDHLMDFGLNPENKIRIDVSKGLLNIMEPIKTQDVIDHPERILSHFPSHINNIIALLGQFREIKQVSTTDKFAAIARDILIAFFVTNKYWVYDAENNLGELRFYGRHDQYKMLKDFGSYVAQRLKVNRDSRLEEALSELDIIINRTILPTIPAMNTKTDDSIDQLVNTKYRVLDLTGMGQGVLTAVDNPSMNVMMIAYLNVLLPALNNGDLVVIHGMSRVTKIAQLIQDILSSSGFNIDVLFTESNQNMSVKTLDVLDSDLDFAIADLYDNRLDKLIDRLGMDERWTQELMQSKAAHFVRTKNGMDYIYLDEIL
jgi:hypothetical protein